MSRDAVQPVRWQPERGELGPAAGAGRGTLATVLSDVARSLAAEEGMAATLAAIVDGAVATVPGADAAGVTEVYARRRLEVRYATSDVVRAADGVQEQTGQGPCLDAAYDQPTVRIADLRKEVRWPAFSAKVRELGLGSILCLRLYVAEDTLGALNLYARQPAAFDDLSEEVGLLFATHAALAIAGARHVEQLTAALGTRDVIGQAKGVLMERYQVTAPTAFALLTRASQRSGQGLHDVAEALAGTRGDLPPQRPVPTAPRSGALAQPRREGPVVQPPHGQRSNQSPAV